MTVSQWLLFGGIAGMCVALLAALAAVTLLLLRKQKLRHLLDADYGPEE